MAQRLKRWESPRSEGRNQKGRGGSAKQRQYKKRQNLLVKRLQEGSDRAKLKPEIKPKMTLETKLTSAKINKKYKKKEAIEQPLFFAFSSLMTPVKTSPYRCNFPNNLSDFGRAGGKAS